MFKMKNYLILGVVFIIILSILAVGCNNHKSEATPTPTPTTSVEPTPSNSTEPPVTPTATLPPEPTPTATVVVPQPVSEWKFEAIFTDAADENREYVIDNIGTTTLSASSSEILGVFSIDPFGVSGNCVKLTQVKAGVGEYNYFKRSHDTNLNLRNAITIETWVKLTALPGTVNNVCLVDRIATGGYRMYLRGGASSPDDNNTVRFKINSTEANSGTTGVKIDQLNTWYHIVGTFDGSNVKIYVNGVLADTRALSGQITDNPDDDLKVAGESESSPKSIQGSIDEWRIYNVALTEEQVQARYNLLKP